MERNVPLGWDGELHGLVDDDNDDYDNDDDDDDDDDEPIPYWLYKLHGLDHKYSCEICGNYAYFGRRAFDRHFQVGAWRHLVMAGQRVCRIRRISGLVTTRK